MRHLSPFLLSLLLAASPLYANVPPNNGLIVEAGDDITVCAPGETVDLNGTVFGLYNNVEWTPSGGMADPFSESTSVFVSETTTFTLTAYGAGTDQNLIVNGDFSGGISGFTSQYVVGTGGPWGQLSNEGTYAVSTNSNLLHSNWASCTDNSGGGEMLVVNGATTPGENVWCQTVPVMPNTVYEFSAWLTSVISENPANLQFSINGQLIGAPFDVPGLTCNWNQFFETWDSGFNASAEICITNQNTQPSGNDFAIDDISFGPVCNASDEITVTVVELFADVVPVALLPCDADGVSLNGIPSIDPTAIYQWTTSDGNIVSGENTLTPFVDAPGTYVFSVSIPTLNGVCTSTAEVSVIGNQPPIADAVTIANIDCANSIGSVSGAGSGPAGSLSFEWSTMDGLILSGADDLNASVAEEGTYMLTVTDVSTGCTSTASTIVSSTSEIPTAIAAALGELDCTDLTVTLDGSTSFGTNNLDFQWTPSSGNIIGPASGPTIEVDEAGVYELTVTDVVSGCTASTTVPVFGNTDPPVPSILPPANLDCTGNGTSLDASASAGSGTLSFNWATPDGNITSGGTTPAPSINQAGSYFVTITDSDNGCTAEADVTVTGNTTPPVPSILPPANLDCTGNGTSLDASPSTGSGTLSFDWATPDGNITSGGMTPTPSINQAGTYFVTITDSDNGCTAEADVTVTGNTTPPNVVIATPDQITCQATDVALDASGSSPGVGFIWGTVNGSIVAGANESIATASATGIYTVTVTDSGTGCTATASVNVSADQALPNADAGQPLGLDCSTSSLQLDGSNSDGGTDISYEWTTGDGNILSGENSLVPTVGAAGTYLLTVTNSTTGCTASSSVLVSQNNDLPGVQATVNDTLNCGTSSLTIDASGSSSGTDFNFVWSTSDGNFAAGENTLMPTVDEAGNYLLTITNIASSCTASFNVEVMENFATPAIDIVPPTLLTCTSTEQVLDATASTFAAGANILWSTSDGNISAGANTLEPIIDEPGIYILTITDPASGCTDEATVNVAENIAQPNADAGSPDTLTCLLNSLSLDGGASSQGADFSYAWSYTPPAGATGGAGVSAGANTLTPTIDAAGTYEILVTNDLTGCTNTSQVIIASDGEFPAVEAGPDSELTCVFTETNLNGSGDMGAGFEYEWNYTPPVGGTGGAGISAGANTLEPTIDAPGTYTLTVTNTTNGCTASDAVNITENVAAPTADAGNPTEITCTQTEVSLSGNGSASGTASLIWTTANGNILSGANTPSPMVNAAGIYVLTVTDGANGCTATSTVTVTEDASLPIANAGTSPDLTCLVNDLDLDGTGSSMGANFSYTWTTGDGNILSGANSLTPNVDAPGTYLLTVTNTASNCTSISTVTVLADDQPPVASAGQPGLLTCAVTDLPLDGTGSDTGNNFSYAWTTPDGNILANADSPEPTVDEPGTYEILVTNELTGCTSTASVLVSENMAPPAASALSPDMLTCQMTSFSLDGTGSSTGAGFNYIWTTIGGNILANADSPTPTVDAPGMYEILVTNSLTGCTATASVMVSEDMDEPVADAGPGMELTCETNSLSLNGSASSQGPDFVFSWTTPNGNIFGGANSPAPQIDEPGTYFLTVSDQTNGCTATATVAVTLDDESPIIAISPPAPLTCVTDEIQLDASASSMGSGLEFLWASQNGNIVDGQGSALLTVDEPGNYSLIITDPSNGCSASQNVAVAEDIDLPEVEAGATLELNCNLTSAALQASTDLALSDLSATWTTMDGEVLSGNNTLTPTIGTPGTYLLTVTNLTNSCSDSDEVTITENILEDFVSLTLPPGCIVPTGAIEFSEVVGGQPPFQYSVDGGQNFSTDTAFGNLPTGTYDLMVQDANGCLLDDVAYLPEAPEILLSLDADEIISLGDSYQLNAQTSLTPDQIGSVEWTPAESLSCADCLRPLATPTQQTSYTVMVRSKDGCEATAQTTLFIRKEKGIYVPNAFSPNGDGINDMFLIFSGGNSIERIGSFQIYDRWGEAVFEYFNFQPNDPTFGWDGHFQGEALDPAVFVWWVEVEYIDGSTEFLKGDVTLMR